MMRRVWRTCGSGATKRFFAVGKKSTSFSIDRSGLGKLDVDVPETSTVAKEPLTALGKDLQSYIKLKGPITLHDYMAQSLNHMVHGYYQSKNEVIGEKGDFITAPEVSQLFGEMLGIWCLSMWEQMGRPAKLNLIELGPGKGTLMKDMLRVAERFAPFKQAISVHLVELSLSLRVKQYEALSCTGGHLASTSGTAAGDIGITDRKEYRTARDVPVHWNSFLYQVPDDVPSLIIGQEFLDAFPVHQFTYTEKGWREKLVDVNKGAASVSHKPVVSSGNPRIAAAKARVLEASAAALDNDAANAAGTDNAGGEGDEDAAKYHFRLVLSPTATPAVKSLLDKQHRPAVAPVSTPSSSATAGAADPAATLITEPAPLNFSGSPKVGDGLEISPLAIATCEDIARRVVRSGGAALLVDYGEDFTQEDSLRAFQKHKQVSVLSQPGIVDVTADVDFSICRKAAERRGAKVMPLLTQGQFLMRMGIVSRVEQLIEAPGTTDEEGTMLFNALKYLADPQQMGQRFKVLSIANPALTTVTGFESPNDV